MPLSSSTLHKAIVTFVFLLILISLIAPIVCNPLHNRGHTSRNKCLKKCVNELSTCVTMARETGDVIYCYLRRTGCGEVCYKKRLQRMRNKLAQCENSCWNTVVKTTRWCQAVSRSHFFLGIIQVKDYVFHSAFFWICFLYYICIYRVFKIIRDRSKFTGYLGRVLGKICLKKKYSPPFF